MLRQWKARLSTPVPKLSGLSLIKVVTIGTYSVSCAWPGIIIDTYNFKKKIFNSFCFLTFSVAKLYTT